MSEALSHNEFLNTIVFDDDGLVPVIAQDHKSGAVLMLAWMNRDTLERTLKTGEVTYWSRSRREVWRKGATSGHTQKLIEAYADCDGDALLFKVDQTGAACHTGSVVCFYRRFSR
jgi:phosphoribosyl-AMP cyclohydrolase